MATTTDAPVDPAGAGDEADDRKLIFGRFGFWLVTVGVVTMLAGTLFGYDQGVISGALPFIQTDFGLTSFLTEVVTSWVTLGALVGPLVAGGLADKLGRKNTGVLAGIPFCAGAAISALAPDTATTPLRRACQTHRP